MPSYATFSIVAFDPQEDALGVAVASKFLAVGGVVPWVRAGAGAVATQSYANTSFGPLGLDLMAAGLSAQAALDQLLADDPEAERRQVGVVDSHGGSATFTGSGCHDWAGGLTGEGFAVQGNILAGEPVVQAMAAAYQATGKNLMWRLFEALRAGDQAGGDRRGRQSAAIYIAKPQGGYGGYNDRWVDYRVDDHPDPIARLGDILTLHDLYFGESPPHEQLALDGEVLASLQVVMNAQGYYLGPAHGRLDTATRQALVDFIGNENFEERLDLENGTIDQPVYRYLMDRFGESQ